MSRSSEKENSTSITKKAGNKLDRSNPVAETVEYSSCIVEELGIEGQSMV